MLVPLAARRVLGPLAEGIASAAPPAWTSMVNASCEGPNLLTSGSGWGRAIAQIVGDGSATVVIGDSIPGQWLFGIGTSDSPDNFTIWNYMLRLYSPASASYALMWEDYVQKYWNGTVGNVVGDRWGFAVSGGVVTLTRNGATLYTSSKTPGSPLYVMANANYSGAHFDSLVVVP
jgi:hypothetical protein